MQGTGRYPDTFGSLSYNSTHEHINPKLQKKLFAHPTTQAENFNFYSTFYSPAGIQPGIFDDSKQSSSSARAACHNDLKVAVSASAQGLYSPPGSTLGPKSFRVNIVSEHVSASVVS